jgi:hemin uptake protein HemP
MTTPAPAQPATAGQERPVPVLPSTALLQGQRAVAIEHNGTVYRLQATRQGKLILTK